MKVSELIEKLECFKKTNGDLDVNVTHVTSVKRQKYDPQRREGKKIRRTNEAWKACHYCIDEVAMFMCHGICCLDLLEDDWEVVE